MAQSFGQQALCGHFAFVNSCSMSSMSFGQKHSVLRHSTEMIFRQWPVIRLAFCFANAYPMSFSQKPFGLQTFGQDDVRLMQMWLCHLAIRH